MNRVRSLGYATVGILKTIRDGARYGFEIMEKTGLPSGTVYPTLGRLMRRGYVGAHWEDRYDAYRDGRPRRRYYRMTPRGDVALEEALARFAQLYGQS